MTGTPLAKEKAKMLLTQETAEMFVEEFRALLRKYEVTFHVDDRGGQLVMSIHQVNGTTYADISVRKK